MKWGHHDSMARKHRIAAPLILFLLPTLAHADFSGKVVKVYDGDTITVLNDQNESVKIGFP